MNKFESIIRGRELIESNKHNMNNYPGDYKGHSYKVLTSKSIYDLIIEDEDGDIHYEEVEQVIDNEYDKIFSKYLPDYTRTTEYPMIFNFEVDSKEVEDKLSNLEDIISPDEDVELVDIATDEGARVYCISELYEIMVDKMGGDLVLWDTGYIGMVAYGNYGPTEGAEILPIEI